jgi:TonB family protein
VSAFDPAELFPVPESGARLGAPTVISAAAHAALVFLLATLMSKVTLTPVDPVRVMEISVMGKADLALKGDGRDYSTGPLPAEEALAAPARDKRAAASGNTRKASEALAAEAPPEVPVLPSLSAKTPIFSATGNSYSAGTVGREKIYVSAKTKFRPEAEEPARPARGEGLVGVSGEAVDLAATRGAAGSAEGKSDYLGSGRGSITGGAVLSRRGEPVIYQTRKVSDDPLVDSRRKVKIEAASDDFFTVNGPLKGRKIVKMTLPKYPRWAEQRGLEARVAVRITVNPRGKVKAGMLTEQTSGYPELDELVRDAVAKFVFAPAQQGEGDQWGILTFNFSLKKAQAAA